MTPIEHGHFRDWIRHEAVRPKFSAPAEAVELANDVLARAFPVCMRPLAEVHLPRFLGEIVTILDLDLLNSTREGAVREFDSRRHCGPPRIIRETTCQRRGWRTLCVALLLRRPLLLTGEAGTGKTQAAHFMSWKLGSGEQALRFEAKSTSTARDLFYMFDTIGGFTRPRQR